MDNRIYIINKPKDFTSQDVVSKVKKILNIPKAGHTGTLDPLAIGVLPILTGGTTKLSKYLIEHDKTYIATIEFGKKTSTGDSEGEIVEQQDVNDNVYDNLQDAINSFVGQIEQTPPMYSAIKVAGKKLYEYARSGKTVEVPKRIVNIYDIQVLNCDKTNNRVSIKVSCSSGTYIRTLCEDIATALGTVGYMCDLQRVQVDKFTIEQSITLDELEQNKDNLDWLIANSFDMEQVLSYLPRIDISYKRINYFLNGGLIELQDFNDGVYNIYSNNKYIGTGILKSNVLKRDIIL